MEKTRLQKFTRAKETKATVVFEACQAEGQPPIIRCVYVEKWFCGNSPSIWLEVSLEPQAKEGAK
jgi:hypothetical protein